MQTSQETRPVTTRTRELSLWPCIHLPAHRTWRSAACQENSLGHDPCFRGNPTSKLPSLGSSLRKKRVILACKLHCAWADWNEGGALTKDGFPCDGVPRQKARVSVSGGLLALPFFLLAFENQAMQCNTAYRMRDFPFILFSLGPKRRPAQHVMPCLYLAQGNKLDARRHGI